MSTKKNCHVDHSKHDHAHTHTFEYNPENIGFKRALWIALILNLGMFFVEIIYGILSHSLALRADGIDFLGDSINYFATLFVLKSTFNRKAQLSMVKSIFMIAFGVWILILGFNKFLTAEVPNPLTIAWVGVLALFVNGICVLLLFKFRDGDSNMQSVWLCSRNDALGNLAVIFASAGIYYWGTQWPDLIVAVFMASMAIHSGKKIFSSARNELNLSLKTDDGKK